MTDKEILMTQELIEAVRSAGAGEDVLERAGAFVGRPLAEWVSKYLHSALWFLASKECRGEVLTAVSSAMSATVHKDEDGNLHRDDGPAINYRGGSEDWFCHGKLHRENGPALVRPNGHQEWWYLGQLHREHGPAFIDKDGNSMWFKHGVRVQPPKK